MPEMVNSIASTPGAGSLPVSPDSGPPNCTVFAQGSGYVVARSGSYVILINVRDLQASTAIALHAALTSGTLSHSKVAYLIVLERTMKLMLEHSIRADLAAVMAAFARAFTGVAVVYEGTGFKATVVRSILTSIHLASRATFSNQVFSNVEAGLAWLSGTLPPGAPPKRKELSELVRELRTRA
jgi:hypothetical protein